MAGEGLSNFTARELELLTGGLLCLKSGDIAVDYEKFAVRCNFKNANSAKASWCSLRKKLDKLTNQGPTNGGDDAAVGGKRKEKSSSEEDGGASPKKKRGKKATKSGPAESDHEDAVEGDTDTDEVITKQELED